jgi:hypothetical protein
MQGGLHCLAVRHLPGACELELSSTISHLNHLKVTTVQSGSILESLMAHNFHIKIHMNSYDSSKVACIQVKQLPQLAAENHAM